VVETTQAASTPLEPLPAEQPATKRLRVAYIVCRFDVGGLERVAAHLVNGLDRSMFEPFIFCLERTGSAEHWLSNDQTRIIELNKRAGNDPKVVIRLAAALRENHIDVAHSHNWGTLVETTLARRLARTPVHLHAEHGQELDSLQAGGLRRVLRNAATRWALKRANAVVVCAESVRLRIHERCKFPGDDMLCIPNGVDVPSHATASDELRSRIGIGDDALVLGSLSRLVPVKDFSTAVEMMQHLRGGRPAIHLVLVGDGPEEKLLRDRAADLDVAERVHFVGRQENIADWLGMFDIYLNSSLSEALSMGLLEAMSLGLPCLVTDVGDHAAVVGGDSPCGLAVPAGSPQQLARAVTSLVQNKELRHDLGCEARKRYAEFYTTERMVTDYASLYRRLHSAKMARRS